MPLLYSLHRPVFAVLMLATLGIASSAASAQAAKATLLPTTRPGYRGAAEAVTQDIETNFSLGRRGLYAHSRTDRSPDFMWGNGIQFAALLAAARHDPKTYGPIRDRFFTAMDAYWDTKAPIPGYEPSPTAGRGN